MRRQALIAEDNPEQQLLLQKLVRTVDPGLGIRVVDSYEGAVAALADPDETYEWVLSDLYLLGEKTGVDLLRFCRTWFPSTQVALISGASVPQVTRLMGELDGTRTVIPKSVPVPELKRRLERLMGPPDKTPYARTVAASAGTLGRNGIAGDFFYALAIAASLLLAKELSERPAFVPVAAQDSIRAAIASLEKSHPKAADAPLIRAFSDPEVRSAVKGLQEGGLTPMLRAGNFRASR